jgi:hypothetical protein
MKCGRGNLLDGNRVVNDLGCIELAVQSANQGRLVQSAYGLCKGSHEVA